MSEPRGFPSVGGDGPAPDRRPPADDTVDTVAATSFGSPGISDPAVDVTASSGRDNRWRWFAAGLATLLVVALVGGTLLFLGPRAGTPSLVAQFAPADVPAFIELRLDLPGDQRDRLASFMSNFPGFADPASFQQKIDETLANAVAGTESGLDWRRDVEPWFGGQIGIFTTSLEPAYGTPPPFTAVMSVKDRDKLNELVTARLNASELTPEEYKGRTIWSGTPSAATGPMSFAATDEVVIVSLRNEDLKAALDVRANEKQGLADDAFFLGQLGALHADRLGLFYFDSSRAVQAVPTGLSSLPTECAQALEGAVNNRVLGELRAESDHMAVNVRSQFATGEGLPPAPSNKRTALAERMPAVTVAYLETRQLGANLRYLVDQLLTCILPAIAGAPLDVSQLEQLIGTSPREYFDFLDDAAVGITLSDGRFGGGLIATVDDEAVARTRIERLLSAVRLLGGLGGGGITVDEETHGDATITVISMGAGMVPEAEASSISVTVSGGLLYLGIGDFVTGALDRTAADSLAAGPRLQSALSSAGADNAGIIYVDIAAVRGFLETQVPDFIEGDYQTEHKPFIEPLTHFVLVSRNEGGFNAGHAFLYVE